MARAGVGVAKPCDDASSIFYNPAGLAGASGFTLSAGVTAIAAYGSFTDDFTGAEWDLANSTIPVPHVYASYGVTPQLTAGIGMFVPYGLGTKWPLDTSMTAVELRQTDAFPGRFLGWDSDLNSIYIQPTVAYRLNDMLAVGAGFDFVIGSIDLNQRLDLSEYNVPGASESFGQLGIPPGTDFANGHLYASGATGIGGHFGIIVRPVPRLQLGARYISKVTLDYDGNADFTQVPTGVVLPPNNPIALATCTPTCALDPTQPLPLDLVLAGANLFSSGSLLGDQTVTTSITMPDQLSAGLAFDVAPTLTLMADWQWVHWEVFYELVAHLSGGDSLRLEDDYHNTNAIRVGFEWWASDRFALRGGYLKHQGAAPPQSVTPLLPEGSRNEFTGGIGVRLSSMLSADLAYQFLRQDKVRGRVVEPISGSPTVALNSGLYVFNAHLAAITVTAHF